MRLEGVLRSGFALTGNANVQIELDQLKQPTYREINEACEALRGKHVVLTVEGEGAA